MAGNDQGNLNSSFYSLEIDQAAGLSLASPPISKPEKSGLVLEIFGDVSGVTCCVSTKRQLPFPVARAICGDCFLRLFLH